MKKIIGAITVGQSPRVDVTCDIAHIFGSDVELLEAGALDGLSKEEIGAFTPSPEDYVLVSRLNDGSSVTFAERYIIPRLQQCIRDLEARGAQIIIFFCTGKFPQFDASVPLVFPNHILKGVVPALTTSSNIAVISPSPAQVEQSKTRWKACVDHVTVIPASPYGGDKAKLVEAANMVKDLDADLVVLDCIGYTQEMKRLFTDITNKNVVLARTLMARVACEILDRG